MYKLRKSTIICAVLMFLLPAALFRNLIHQLQMCESLKSQQFNPALLANGVYCKNGRCVPLQEEFFQRGKARPSINYCEKEQCVPTGVNIKWAAMYNKVPKYKIANCAIPKSLSTMTMAVICYLFDYKLFEKMNRTIAGEADWPHRGCKSNNRQVVDTHLLQDPEWAHFAVIREPIERFLSGWMDKCFNLPDINKGVRNNPIWCHGCKKNLTCFVEKNYEWNMNIPKHYSANYSIRNQEDHFWPQNWFCNFSKYHDHYTILRYSPDKAKIAELFETLTAIFRKQKVEEELTAKIIGQASATRPVHATLGRNYTEIFREQLLKDKRLMRILVETYYHDFIMFSYPFPEL